MTGFAKVTAAQQQVWATGDFHRIGVSQVGVGERLVRSLQVHAGERVLDVAGGAGNTALAAARRWADVTCTDYVPDLLEHATARAAAEGLPLAVGVADAQDLPYDDGSFDVVTSTFGAMFAPDQERTGSELLRVLRPGGRLGLASWTPDSWVGFTFRLASEFRPPPPGVAPPMVWGTRDGVARLLGEGVEISARERISDFVHQSAEALFALFASWFGPTASLLRALDEERAAEFQRRWLAGTREANVATDGTLVVPSPYLEVVAVKR
jgi:ubiquinone/menaquinone biosynthesis C-methylase UbiE